MRFDQYIKLRKTAFHDIFCESPELFFLLFFIFIFFNGSDIGHVHFWPIFT